MRLSSIVYTVRLLAMFGHVPTFKVFYYVYHLRLSSSVYMFFILLSTCLFCFYGPCCLIQVNDDDDDDDDDDIGI